MALLHESAEKAGQILDVLFRKIQNLVFFFCLIHGATPTST